jgi:ABC-2 type transport system ATP-binding protein
MVAPTISEHVDAPIDTEASKSACLEGTVVDGRIVVSNLTKVFGGLRAVDDLSFTVEPGSVMGFLGPNGAGKTTTLRCLLGLISPTKGTATISGRRYCELAHPLATVGALLESSDFHPGRTARNHLLVLCMAAAIPDRRADEVLEMTGMTNTANRRVGTFSTGMRQRLGLAAALLGDPSVLVLDEPANGLDPAGINWVRQMLRYLAGEGKTVLVSSHLLAEMEHTADNIVIIDKGRLIQTGRLADILGTTTSVVRVRTPRPDLLRAALIGAGLTAEPRDGALVVAHTDAARVGHLAFTAGIELQELTEERSDLEQVFLELTTNAERTGP